MITQAFTLGVNYWSSRKAMYWWSDFDPGEVREEFFLIHDLGLRMVRFGNPNDLPGTVLWLVSPASAFVTGIVVLVDGGFSAFGGI